MLTITNMKWPTKDFSHNNELLRVLGARFATVKLATNLKVVDNSLVFKDVDANKVFMSSEINKTVMKPDDPRIKKKGRNFLETRRPTKVQHEAFYSIIQNTLDELGLDAEIQLTIKSSTPLILRQGKVRFDRVPVPKSYPVEMEK